MFRRLIAILMLLSIVVPATAQGSKQHVKLSARPSQLTVKAGEKFSIKLSVNFDKHWHGYGLREIIGPDGIGPTPTEFSLKPADMIQVKGKPKVAKLITKYDEGFRTKIELMEGSTSVEIPVLAKKDIDFSKNKITVVAFMQLCDTASCLPPDDYKTVVSKETYKAGNDLDFTDEAVSVPDNKKQMDSVASTNLKKGTDAQKGGTTESQKQIDTMKSRGVFSFLWFAMSAGALALLTPCVFPMVPITVSFFTKRAETHKGKGLRDSLIYAFGIITTFTALGIILALIFGATGIRDFATNGWVNILIAAIFIIFSLNLFGAFEIQVPTALLNKLNAKSQGSGVVSVFLMALTFSLTSFTCTVPFVGSALISASTGEWFYPIIGMLGFSAVFASPFFLLALFPSAMKTLPKAGGWMNNVKVVMGFLEIAAAIKFVSNADLVWSWGIMPKELFVGIWIGIFVLIALYILGMFRLPHDAPTQGVGALRLVWAIFFSGLAFFLMSGLNGKKLGELDAFLPPAEYYELMSAGSAGGSTAPAATTEAGNAVSGQEEFWYDNYATALAEAKKQNKALLVDFTGFTCTNCRWMEQNMFKRPAIHALFGKVVKVRLYTDRRVEPFISNKKMQESRYGSIELPLYVMLTPDEQLLGTKTFTRDEADFTAFLQKGADFGKK